jgi:hypothetical protein
MNSITRYANFDSRIVNINYIIEYSLKNRGFDLPPSQREKEWVNEQNSKFIHSIFENKPLGSFIFNKRNDKTYILDGQHRINALELFTKDNFGVKSKKNYIFYDGFSVNARRTELNGNKKIIGLTEEEKREFLDTEIFIREYKNLSDDEMADIIDSINEGIKNDNVNTKKDINNDDLINNLINDCSEIIFSKEYSKIKESDKIELKKYIGYVGTIIKNFDSYESSSKYTQLNSHHVKHFYNNLKKDTDNIEDLIKDIKNFINLLYSENILNHKDTLKVTDKYDLNNYYLNCIYYKVYEKYNQNIDIDNKKIRNTIIELIENYNGVQFRDLMECFDTIYNKCDKTNKIKEI